MRLKELRELIADMDDDMELVVWYTDETGNDCESFPKLYSVSDEYFILEA